MKVKLLVLLFFAFVFNTNAKPVLQFLSPEPNSKYVKISSSLIFRFTSKIEVHNLNNAVQINGNKSGSHNFNSKVSDDGYTVIVTPDAKFKNAEKIDVNIAPLKTDAGYTENLKYSFETEKENLPVSSVDILKNELASSDNFNMKPGLQIPFVNKSGGTLPAGFPQITISNSNAPSPGYIFLSNFSLSSASIEYYLMILDNDGTPVYYKSLDTAAYDFKKQPNGNLTYYYSKAQKFFEMNERYEVIDSFQCGNGYSTDLHELRLLENGHALLMSYDPQRVNMRAYVSNGDTNATVLGLIIQELDEDKNIIFQWRSWDHFAITDATHEDLSLPVIDYVHGNAIEVSNDGNLLISSRHMDEITKINRNNGSIIWRLGGKHNQFNFIGDSIAFSHQHAVRELPNGNITLFDNGNYAGRYVPIHDGPQAAPFSRAIEYRINEANHTAENVWQYKNVPPIYGYAMGYVERLNNGNTIISWGAANPTFTEVNPAGEKVYEMSLPAGEVSYRTLKDTWNPIPFTNSGEAAPDSYKLYQNYPNPFNPNTTIKFDLPEETDVKISIFNILGQVVNEELMNNVSAGPQTFIFNGAGLTSGVYFYRLKTNTFTDTKRMLLVK